MKRAEAIRMHTLSQVHIELSEVYSSLLLANDREAFELKQEIVELRKLVQKLGG